MFEHLLAQRGVHRTPPRSRAVRRYRPARRSARYPPDGHPASAPKAQLEVEHHRDARQARTGEVGVQDDQADRLAVESQDGDLGFGLDEDLEALRRDLQEEATEQAHRVIGVLIRRAVFLDLQRTDDLDREGLRRQLEGLALGAAGRSTLAVLVLELEEVGRAELLASAASRVMIFHCWPRMIVCTLAPVRSDRGFACCQPCPCT
jgi:hypothetical protein